MFKMINTLLKRYRFLLVIAFVGCLLASACSDNSTSGELGSVPEAAFTVTPLSDNANKVVVESTTEDAFMWRWDLGNGASSTQQVDTATYINSGDYTINLTTFGEGGSDSTSKQVTIENDYQGQNVLRNDGALTDGNWTYLNIPGGGAIDVTYSNNTVNFTNSQFSYGAIYMPVEVEAGTEYIFSAEVEGSGMGNESWFEVYLGTTEPVQGSDYTDNQFLALNTYVPCGDSPFDGDLVDLACSGSGTESGGITSFSETGTIYLVIKPGSNGGTLGEGGVTLTHISLAQL